jgi:hypothetical protein
MMSKQAQHPSMAFANALSETRRRAYFILETIRSEDGQLIPCIAIEGVAGYYQTDWMWGTDVRKAEAIAQKMNDKLGISAADADRIVLSTMRKAVFN